MMPMRIQRRRTKGWKMPPNTVTVDRNGPHGNPFIVNPHVRLGSRSGGTFWCVPTVVDAVECYSEMVEEIAISQPKRYEDEFVEPLRGKNLACWCPLCPAHADGKPLGVRCEDCSPCHADVLLTAVNGPKPRGTFCHCRNERIPSSRCDRCGPDDDDRYEDPPLYPPGKLAGMSLEELERESDRQAGRQGSLGDAEHIDEMAVQETEARWRLVDNEIKRRKESLK